MTYQRLVEVHVPGTEIMICDSCGALVIDTAKHDDFHVGDEHGE